MLRIFQKRSVIHISYDNQFQHLVKKNQLMEQQIKEQNEKISNIVFNNQHNFTNNYYTSINGHENSHINSKLHNSHLFINEYGNENEYGITPYSFGYDDEIEECELTDDVKYLFEKVEELEQKNFILTQKMSIIESFIEKILKSE